MAHKLIYGALALLSAPMAAETASAQSIPRTAAAFLTIGSLGDAPLGFEMMCARDPALCNAPSGTGNASSMITAVAAPPPLDLHMLKRVNTHVNNRVHQESDQAAFGVSEYWRRSGVDRYAVGDCEDIALEKQAELRSAGYPASATMLAVVYGRRAGLHTVLVVRTEGGDYVLDNMTQSVKPWVKVHYSWLRIQSPGDGALWRKFDGILPGALAPSQVAIYNAPSPAAKKDV